MQATIDRIEAATAAYEEYIESPAAEAAREQSETAFDDLGATSAVQTLNEEFPGLLEGLSDPAVEPSEISKYVSDTVAVVDPDQGPAALVKSQLPLRTVDETGQKVPVDLALEATTGGFAPSAPLIETGLAETSSGSFGVGDTELSLDEGSASRGRLTTDAGAVFYPNVAPDADLLVNAVDPGLEFSWQLRSPESPERFPVELDAGPGTALSLSDAGIAVQRNGQTEGLLHQPAAVDAQGQPVTARLELTDGQASVVIDHQHQDLAYPIFVDPIYDVYWWQATGQGSRLADWSYGTTDSRITGATSCSGFCYPYGLYMGVPSGAYYPTTQANWVYTVPHYGASGLSTYISRVDLSAMSYASSSSSDTSGYPLLLTGIWSPGIGDYTGLKYFHRVPNSACGSSTEPYCGSPSTAVEPGHERSTMTFANKKTGRQFNFQMWVPAGTYALVGATRLSYLGNATIYLSDLEPPDVNPAITHDGVPTAGNNQPTWTKSMGMASATVSAFDPGIGIKRYQLFTQESTGTEDEIVDNSCTGVRPSACPRADWRTLSYDLSKMNNGVNGAAVWVYDAIGTSGNPANAFEVAVGPTSHAGAQAWSVMIDRAAPTLSVTGSGRAASGSGTHLHIEANDHSDTSSAATARSGVKSVQVKVGNDVVYSDTLRCKRAYFSCPSTFTWDIDVPYLKATQPGSLGYEVIVKDQADNQTPDTWGRQTQEQGTFFRRSGDGNPEPCQANGKPKSNVKPTYYRNRTIGTPCDDELTIGAKIDIVDGRAGNDVLISGGRDQRLKGGSGDDKIYGERGNDYIFGQGGDDLLTGGIGDDFMYGGAGADILAGGQGTDKVRGQQNNDLVRGGGTQDELVGGGGSDTLSYADGTSPGFGGAGPSGVSGFPSDQNRRGIKLNVQTLEQEGGIAKYGGGFDEILDHFEVYVGTAFSDHITGSTQVEQIDGGAGGDVITGGGAPSGQQDELRGGPDGDYLDGNGQASLFGGSGASETNNPDGCVNGTSTAGCEITDPNATPTVHPPGTGSLTVGLLQPDDTSLKTDDFYVMGTTEPDNIRATLENGKVHFYNRSGGNGGFSTAAAVAGGCTHVSNSHVSCDVNRTVGAVVLAGLGGSDDLHTDNLPRGTSVMLLGGVGRDDLRGWKFADNLIDGPDQNGGVELVKGAAGDDALFNNDGNDNLEADGGNDLLLNADVCGGNTVDGGDGSDNSSWTQVRGDGVDYGVYAVIGGNLGKSGGENPNCGSQALDSLSLVEDLEGSPQNDVFKGNGANNRLLGRGSPDKLLGGDGSDKLLANDDAVDTTLNCEGDDDQRPVIDKFVTDPTPVSCGTPPIKKKAFYKTRPIVERSADEMIVGGVDDDTVVSPHVFYRTEETSGQVLNAWETDGLTGLYKTDGSVGPQLGVPGAMEEDPESGAVRLDGVDDYLQLAHGIGPAALNGPGYSVETWVKLDPTATGAQPILSHRRASGDGDGLALVRNANGTVSFSSILSEGTPTITSAQAINDGLWHHVVGTLSGTEISLFVDGTPYRLGYGINVTPAQVANPQTLIGKDPTMSGRLKADVDSVAIYDEALSQSTVDDHLTVSAVGEPETTPVLPGDLTDSDSDGVVDSADNCAAVANAGQEDADQNGIGDVCDAGLDADGDTIVDSSDNCPDVYNQDQLDVNTNGIGDACEEPL